MLFECWVIYLGLRYIVVCLWFIHTRRQVSHNNATKTNTNKKKRRSNKTTTATSSADNTENEQESRGAVAYSSTPIAFTKRTFHITEGDDDDEEPASESHHHVSTDLEDEGIFNSGITHKPAGRTGEPATDNAIIPHGIKRDNIYGAVFKKNEGEGSNYNATSNNNNDPYGGSVANKYGYYGRKSFASGMRTLATFICAVSCITQTSPTCLSLHCISEIYNSTGHNTQ